MDLAITIDGICMRLTTATSPAKAKRKQRILVRNDCIRFI